MRTISPYLSRLFSTPKIQRTALLPAPALLCLVILFSALAPARGFECFSLMAANTLLGYTVVNVVAAILLARSFMEFKRPSFLLMGCGAAIWACSGLVVTLGGFILPQQQNSNVNHIITVHNCCVWLSSFCHLSGVSISLDCEIPGKSHKRVLAAAYTLAIAAAGLVIVAAFADRLPTFFTPGTGGTLVRQLVLSSAVGMLILTALILLYLNRQPSPYLHWYPHALILLAVGITAILVQKVNGGWIGWLGRGAQSMGGFYLMIAALLAQEKPATQGISFWQALNEMRQKWVFSTAVAAVVVSLAAAARLLALPYQEIKFPFASYFPAVLIAAAYGGLWPGLVATALSCLMVYWIQTVTGVNYDADSLMFLRTAIFILFGAVVSWAWKGVHHLQKRAIIAEAEAAYASERALAAERLRETVAKLQASEQSFSAFVNTADEGVWVVEADGKTSFINNRLAEILDREMSEIVGKQAREFILSEDMPLFQQQLEIVRTGSVSTCEIRVGRRDGTVTWLHVSTAPLLDSDKAVRGSFSMCTDITSRKQTEKELHHINLHLEQLVTDRSAELSRLNRELESFCYSISHELRAPIARLEAYSHLIKEALAADDAEELPFLSNRIEIASKRMRVVIDSLLMINRLSRTEMQMEKFDLSSLARSIVDELCDETPGRKVLLEVEPHLIARADRAMLSICLRNLFENAFKYSGKKAVVYIKFGAVAGTATYFVRDRGAGFDMAYSHRLFEPFSRLHQEQEFEGSGMGLTIVKRIIERHSGKIWAEGSPGEGATFFFTLNGGGCGNWYGLSGGDDAQSVAVAG